MKLLTMQQHIFQIQAARDNSAEKHSANVWPTMGNLAYATQMIQAVEEANTSAQQIHSHEHLQHKVSSQVVLAPQTAFYRTYTEGLLRRYGVLSMASGRVPSLLGREMFRGKVTSYRIRSFDDVVIFVHDVEQCIKTLTVDQQHLIKRIGIQQFTYGEVAQRLSCSIRSVQRHYSEALDELTSVFLERRLLERIGSDLCQGSGQSAKLVSSSFLKT